MALYINKSKIEPVWDSVEEGKDDLTEFLFVPLRGSKLDEVMDGMNQKTGMLSPVGMNAALRYGVKDWRNLKDLDGNEIKFSLVEFENFSYTTRLNLASKVVSISRMTDDDIKN